MPLLNVITIPLGDSRYPQYLCKSLPKDRVQLVSYKNNTTFFYEDVNQLLKLEPNIIHFHWPEHICDRHNSSGREDEILEKLRVAFQAFHKAGVKIVWPMHNLAAHLKLYPAYEKRVYEFYAEIADGIIHHSNWGKAKALQTFKYKGKHILIPHGYFHNDDCCTLNKSEARKQLEIPFSSNVFFTLGGIIPYKKIEALIDAILLRNNKNDLVIIGGRGEEEYVKDLKKQTEGSSQFRFITEFMSTESLALHARAADAFLFSHGEDNLTTGSPHMSQAFLLPQITQDAPYTREVLGEAAIYFQGNDGASGLANAIEEFTNNDHSDMVSFLKEGRKQYTWKKIGNTTAQFYEELCKN